MKSMSRVNTVTKNHWDRFSEFCMYETMAGGPDPQIPLVGEMSKDEPYVEKLWRAGCYIAVYNVPFAEALWQSWSYKDMQGGGVKRLLPWLQKNWKKIVTRVERKTVRRPEWMFEYMESYFNYINRGLLDRSLQYIHNHGLSPEEAYLYLWDDTIASIKRYGRYVALKLLESYKQYCDMKLVAPDIRPKDGWSPRKTLATLFPNLEVQLNSNDNKYNDLVNATVDRTIQKLEFDYGVLIDRFQLQVMLCEYRESHESKKQYPGRSHDSELGYWHRREALWGEQFYSMNMFSARERIFPTVHLGETNGWMGARKDCGRVLADYGYTWSDMVYSYNATMIRNGNLENPVSWEDANEVETV